MPYIKRPFGVTSTGVVTIKNPVICWKCGQQISIGTFNWTYHTHAPGKYSHKDCHQTPPPSEPKIQLTSQPEAKPIEHDGIHHEKYHHLLSMVRTTKKKNIYVFGAPGSGKSFSLRQLAEKLKLTYTYIALGETSTVTDLMGYVSPLTGTLLRTSFREAYEHGGLLDLPELDNWSANVLTTLNNALDNGWASFPDGMIQRHENCIIIANGNTDLRGPTEQFPERRKQDAASLERFKFIAWSYDEVLEQILFGVSPSCEVIVKYCQRLRQLALDKAMEMVVSTRGIEEVITLWKASDLTLLEILDACILKFHPQASELILLMPIPLVER